LQDRPLWLDLYELEWRLSLSSVGGLLLVLWPELLLPVNDFVLGDDVQVLDLMSRRRRRRCLLV
jgi:hypothetical protein